MTRAIRLAAALAALTAGACASAPPPAPPAPTYEDQLASVLRLEEQRSLRDPAPPPAPVPAGGRSRVRLALVPAPPDLVTLLADADPRVRYRAALAAGRVGLADGVEPLAGRLADPEPDVRRVAAFALGIIGDRSAVAALTAAMEDADPLVRGRAAEALGLIGDAAAAPAIGRMVAGFVRTGALGGVAADETRERLDPPTEAVRLGVYALARLGAWDPLAAAVVSGDGQPLSRWWPIAYAIQRVRDRRAIPSLLLLARAESAESRVFAAVGLGALKEPKAVDLLLPQAEAWRAHPRLAAVAVRALGQIESPRAGPTLLRLLRTRDLDPAVHLEVVAAVGACRVAEALDDLLDLLAHRSPAVRAAALASLRRVDPQSFVIALSGREPDEHWSVRAALAGEVAELDPAIAVPRLTAALADTDLRTRPAVLSALVRIKAPSAGPTVIAHLANDDPVVRASAAALVGQLRLPGGAEALRTAYRFGQRDHTHVARAAALAALVEYGADEARSLLTEALADPEWAVRRRAADLLDRIDAASQAAAAIRPAPTARALDAYRDPSLVAPAVSPHLYLETDRGTITIELDVVNTPLTAYTFAALARNRTFDGVAFHRVVPGFVVQGGDPRGDGEGGPGFTIRDELSPTPFLRGTVGVAIYWRDTGGSQFFIALGPQPHLDGRYTAFGRVVAGMEIVDRLERWDRIRRAWVWDGNPAAR